MTKLHRISLLTCLKLKRVLIRVQLVALISKKHSHFFSVNSDAEVDQILNRLKNCVIKRRKVNVERVKSSGPKRGSGRGGNGRRKSGGRDRTRMNKTKRSGKRRRD